MYLAVDAQYQDDGTGRVAGVLFTEWTDPRATRCWTLELTGAAPYEPGAFYKRELPGILSLLKMLDPPSCIVVDSYVDLGEGHPGLGRHLFNALGRKIPVIGVAKTHFKDAPAVEVLRGDSAKPLYVTAAGVSTEEAAGWVRQMHGGHRIPTLLKTVDHLARTGSVE
jgi:deoxyribonuclease V